LRDAWEQAISDYIRPVLERFDNKVKPTSMFKLSILTKDGVKRVMAIQSRLSDDLHSSSQALNPEAVLLDDLLREVKKAVKPVLNETGFAWLLTYPRCMGAFSSTSSEGERGRSLFTIPGVRRLSFQCAIAPIMESALSESWRPVESSEKL
jgi:hypothetical protein